MGEGHLGYPYDWSRYSNRLGALGVKKAGISGIDHSGYPAGLPEMPPSQRKTWWPVGMHSEKVPQAKDSGKAQKIRGVKMQRGTYRRRVVRVGKPEWRTDLHKHKERGWVRYRCPGPRHTRKR